MFYLAVDSGTTNSRVLLMQNREVLARRKVSIGVRNTAIDGNNRALWGGVRQAIEELVQQVGSSGKPELAIAAGMITSNLGLHEVPHAPAPAGLADLRQKVERKVFTELRSIPFFFVPGVRSGPQRVDLGNAHLVDIIRGEETEVMGALLEFGLQGPLLYVHLGSHTKLIQVDAQNRICGGASTLAGELMHAVHQQTILRNSLPDTFDSPLNTEFLEKGWDYAHRCGLSRALYLVRVLDLGSVYPKHALGAFYLGAVLFEEFRCFDDLCGSDAPHLVVLSGLPHLQPAWLHFFRRLDQSVRALKAEETERAFLAGLHQVLQGLSLES